MNEVRRLRERAGVTQAGLARAAGTSQPAIAAYESGRKSPTLGTLRRLAEAVGLGMSVDFRRPLTREERRSLALHAAIAERLVRDPEGVSARSRRNLALMVQVHGGAAPLLREWRAILDLPVPLLCAKLVDPGPRACELRQVTPFAGVLSATERADTYRSFAREEAG